MEGKKNRKWTYWPRELLFRPEVVPLDRGSRLSFLQHSPGHVTGEKKSERGRGGGLELGGPDWGPAAALLLKAAAAALIQVGPALPLGRVTSPFLGLWGEGREEGKLWLLRSRGGQGWKRERPACGNWGGYYIYFYLWCLSLLIIPSIVSNCS